MAVGGLLRRDVFLKFFDDILVPDDDFSDAIALAKA